MKKIILSLLAFTTLIACNNTEKPNDKSVEQNTIQQTISNNSKSEKTNKDNEPSNVILGTWTGEMSEKKLTIVVEKINESELVGYNILGSKRRNLKGTFTDGAWDQPCTKAYEAILNEPGDDQWDGVFTVKFVGYEDEKETEMGPECMGNLKGVEAFGEWISNNSKMKKDINLVKQK
jgi:hypothetical protein